MLRRIWLYRRHPNELLFSFLIENIYSLSIHITELKKNKKIHCCIHNFAQFPLRLWMLMSFSIDVCMLLHIVGTCQFRQTFGVVCVSLLRAFPCALVTSIQTLFDRFCRVKMSHVRNVWWFCVVGANYFPFTYFKWSAVLLGFYS